MKVFVLGGTGFLGSWIVRALLDQGMQVVVMSRTVNGRLLPDHARLEIVCGSFDDPAALRKRMKGCDAVIHAGPYYPVFSTNEAAQERRALGELRPVLFAAADSGLSKFVFTSSPMVLAGEERAFRRCTYHRIKRRLHDEVSEWTAGGFPGIIVIPGACFGPGDWKPNTGRLILEIAARRLKFIVDGKMNAVDVRDVARGFSAVLVRAAAGSCYQLGNWNCTLAEFAAKVASTAGVPPPRIRIPYAPARTLAHGAEWIQDLSGARRPFLPCSGLDQIRYGAYLDSTSAVQELGYTVTPVGMTIRDTIAYFRSLGYLRTSVPRSAQLEDAPETAGSLSAGSTS